MIAYVLKFYPKLSEAFILDELCELKRQGVPFLIWALGRWDEEKIHPETATIDNCVSYLDTDGLGKVPKAIAMAKLWADDRERLDRARNLLGKKHAEQYRFTFSQSLPRALELKRKGVTHIHAHFANVAADHAMALSLLSGIPFSITLHGSDLLLDEHPTLGLVCEHAEGILTPSRFNAEYLIERHGVPEDKIHVIPNGVVPERFQPGTSSATEVPTVLTVARLEKVKDIPVLIDAYALLEKRGVAFRGIIVGEGSERGVVEERIRNHRLGDRIELRGDLPRGEVESELGRADMFVMSSRTEGFPVSILEAMSCGLPIVAPSITGIPEMVVSGEHGFLVKPQDPAALAEGMERLLTDREIRITFGKAARERVLREYSLAHVVKKKIDFFDSH